MRYFRGPRPQPSFFGFSFVGDRVSGGDRNIFFRHEGRPIRPLLNVASLVSSPTNRGINGVGLSISRSRAAAARMSCSASWAPGFSMLSARSSSRVAARRLCRNWRAPL